MDLGREVANIIAHHSRYALWSRDAAEQILTLIDSDVDYLVNEVEYYKQFIREIKELSGNGT